MKKKCVMKLNEKQKTVLDSKVPVTKTRFEITRSSTVTIQGMVLDTLEILHVVSCGPNPPPEHLDDDIPCNSPNLLRRSMIKWYHEEFDLKSALFSHMNKKKSSNKNTTNYRIYHALMEALISDEDAMDKEVADRTRVGLKEKEDLILPLMGSANLLPKDDDQSSQTDKGVCAICFTKQHQLLTLTGWQITDTRDDGADSSMHRSDPESETPLEYNL
ncbi:hypothetical protein Tco_0821004 [Tanacetum coccineum]|uniref:Uncharacterized protein n=1 Tax=Tanacetum coccineum TaxID=301880 RepID=A0ABQ5AB37_9ASTR